MNFKVLILISIMIFSGLNISYSQSIKSKIIGDWLTSKKDAIVTMYFGSGKNSNKIYGKLTWIDEPNNEDGTPIKDKENPKEALRGRAILGLTIIEDLEWEGDEEEWLWEDGSAYDPESGNTYSFKAFIDPSNPDVLNCRGFIGFSLLGRSEVWTRKK